MRLAHVTPLLALLAAACTSGVTPPGPFYALEGPSTVGGSSTRFDVSAGGGGGACCGWPDGAGGGGLRLRHGIGDELELGASSLWLGHDHSGGLAECDSLGACTAAPSPR